MMNREILIFTVAALALIAVPEATAAKRPCSALKTDIQQMLDAKYTGSETDAPQEYARRIVKAYQMGFVNKNCLTTKEYNGLLTGVTQLRDDCAKAKKDKTTWAEVSKRCNIYKGLYKYIKVNP
jgi:hypothetical protein